LQQLALLDMLLVSIKIEK
jgi:hypothetical protein